MTLLQNTTLIAKDAGKFIWHPQSIKDFEKSRGISRDFSLAAPIDVTRRLFVNYIRIGLYFFSRHARTGI